MKKHLALFLVLCIVLSIVPCSASPVETVSQTSYPVSVTDQAGRTVTVSAEPQRIVSGYYIASSALIALGLQERIVGIEAKADKRPIYRLSAPELIDLPNVGTAKEFNLEGCIALNPDLVILPLKLKAAAESLEQLDIPVILVNPESQTLLFEMIDLIASLTNTTERAEALHSFTAEQETALASREGTAPTVYLSGNSSVLSTAGSGMYQSDLITLAGGQNAAEELTDTYWAEVSYEQLLLWDPEYIILASDAGYSTEDVLSDPNLADCRAVRSGNVYHIPGNIESWDSPIPGGILGAVWLASVLHPEEVTADFQQKTAAAFYEEFYGFTPETN